MDARERFRRLMRFEPVDRLPVIEWAPWWNQTIDRWRSEGLPDELTDYVDIQRHLGLDPMWQLRIRHFGPDTPTPPSHGAGIAADRPAYRRVLPTLYGRGFDAEHLARRADQQRRGDLVIWMTFDGFFWHPRTLLGIQPHLCAFYDQPDLIDEMNERLLDHQRRMLGAVLEVCTPDFCSLAEDMSYNHGPMLSPEMFEQFLAPFYRRFVAMMRSAGIPVMVDSDGDVTGLIGWLEAVGVEGIFPLERMAGVDVPALRRAHPRLRMLGGFDKTVMHLGERAVRDEFERLGPTAAAGGYAISVDHQTPPGVSLADYRRFVALFHEYAARATGA